ncbi:hypothetical protein DFH11DRAFT_67842 [Phellopilus nigrolimitatus]|nr:hypothetical protein DFH11DRAFT_67842 [Phellopilus nigrolimitatus]
MSTMQAVAASDESTFFLDQGFQFDYTPTGVPVPIPTTEQCDTIPLTWGRASFTSGPNPTAPYYIQVYTSTFLFPMVINVGSGLAYDWPVPYIPGTQYQICMFDSNGVSGGCQRMNTVVTKGNSTLDNPPICTNLTYPAAILDVEGIDHTGVLSQYGWVDQCTDISIKPNNGTPPFTLTVAPTLHPPWNMTSNDMSAINWTVQLSWGSPFFISLVDVNGFSWAYGPLHSGGQGPTECLALGATSSTSKKNITDNVAIGSSVGGLVIGLLVGGLASWFFLRQRKGPYYDSYISDRIHNEGGKVEGSQLGGNTAHYSAIPSATQSTFITEEARVRPPHNDSTTGSRRALTLGSGYEIEPFIVPDALLNVSPLPITGSRCDATEQQTSLSPLGRAGSGLEVGDTPESALATFHQGPLTSQPQPRTPGGQIYVVHHDGGGAPVTVYTPEGTEVIELPPRYDGAPEPTHQQRRSAGKNLRTPGSSATSQ